MNGLHPRFGSGSASLTGAWRRVLVVVLALSVAGSVLAPIGFSSTAFAQGNQITSCTVIDEPGNYQLANDITADSPTECIEVRGVEATIDGNNHSITGPGATGDGNPQNSGIVVNQTTMGTDLTVRDVEITGWDYGLFTEYVSGPVTVESAIIRDNGAGVSASYAEQTTIRDTDIEENEAGFVGSSPTGVTLSGVTVQNNNGSGFSATESRDVEIESSTFSDNAGAGIMIGGRAGTFTFTDITVTGNDNHGIGAFADGELVTIDGATVTDNGGNGIASAIDAQITDADIQNNGEHGLGLSGTSNIENTLVAGNDGRELDARDGNASASGLTVGDDAVAAFSNEAVALNAVQQDSLPARSDGEPAGDGMAVEGDVGSVNLELGVETDDDTIDLWRHDGSEWSTVASDISVSDGSIGVTVGNAGMYAPGATAGEETVTPTQTASPTPTPTATPTGTETGPAPVATDTPTSTPASVPGPSGDGNGNTDSTATPTEAAPSNPNPNPNPAPIATGTAGAATATPADTDAPMETAVVGATATATDNEGAGSTEETATATADEANTSDATSPEPADDTENDGPGFGPLVAIGALLVSAVLARRRE